MNRGLKTAAIYIVIVLLAMTFIRFGSPTTTEQVEIADIKNYTQLMENAEAGDLVSVEITTYENTQTVDGKLADGKEFTGVVIPKENAAQILAAFQEAGVIVDQKGNTGAIPMD